MKKRKGETDMDMIIINFVLLTVVTAGLIFKAIVEALYFKEKEYAKQTLKYWGMSAGSLVLSFGFSLLVYYIG